MECIHSGLSVESKESESLLVIKPKGKKLCLDRKYILVFDRTDPWETPWCCMLPQKQGEREIFLENYLCNIMEKVSLIHRCLKNEN